MAGEIKIDFTEDEINEFIAELNSSIGNKRKVDKLLDLNHLPILVAYLRKIGMDEKLLSLAAVVEFTRYKMREVLSDKTLKQCKVTDTGVVFEKNKENSKVEKIGVDKLNLFCLGEHEFFGKQDMSENTERYPIWPKEQYVYLQRRIYDYQNPDRAISNSGWAFGRRNNFGSLYLIDEINRENDGLIYYTTAEIGTDNELITRSRIYAGEAIDVKENENTFRENYEMYCTLFPKYRGWLNNWCLRGVENLDEVVRITDTAIYKERIEKLTNSNLMLQGKVNRELETYKMNKQNLDELMKCLKGYDFKTSEGKRVLDEIRLLIEERKEIDIDRISSDVTTLLKEDDGEQGKPDGENKNDADISSTGKNLNRARELMDFVKLVNSSSDIVGKVNDSNLGLEYHMLKEKAEMLSKEHDRLEECLEELENVNSLNEKLIRTIKERITDIVKVEKDKEEETELIVGSDR